jgi:hypothetical protein
VERFAKRYDGFPRSRSTINRRVQAAAEEADLSGGCLSALPASDRGQLPRLQGCRPCAVTGVDGVE